MIKTSEVNFFQRLKTMDFRMSTFMKKVFRHLELVVGGFTRKYFKKNTYWFIQYKHNLFLVRGNLKYTRIYFQFRNILGNKVIEGRVKYFVEIGIFLQQNTGHPSQGRGNQAKLKA